MRRCLQGLGEYGKAWFQPAKLLERLASEKGSFRDSAQFRAKGADR
jgi:hypothetical protein